MGKNYADDGDDDEDEDMVDPDEEDDAELDESVTSYVAFSNICG